MSQNEVNGSRHWNQSHNGKQRLDCWQTKICPLNIWLILILRVQLPNDYVIWTPEMKAWGRPDIIIPNSLGLALCLKKAFKISKTEGSCPAPRKMWLHKKFHKPKTATLSGIMGGRRNRVCVVCSEACYKFL